MQSVDNIYLVSVSLITNDDLPELDEYRPILSSTSDVITMINGIKTNMRTGSKAILIMKRGFAGVFLFLCCFVVLL